MQRGIDLSSLDASWVSSMSWYFIGAFGMRGESSVKYFFQLEEIILGIYELVLGEDNQADQARAMQQQMPGGSSGPLMDEQKAFKAEWEALKITDYKNALQHIEKTILKQ